MTISSCQREQSTYMHARSPVLDIVLRVTDRLTSLILQSVTHAYHLIYIAAEIIDRQESWHSSGLSNRPPGSQTVTVGYHRECELLT